MSNPVSVTITGSSPVKATPIRVNHFVNPTDAAVYVRIASGTATYSVEGTFEHADSYADVATFNSSAVWVAISSGFTAQTTSQIGSLAVPVQYIRLNGTAMSSATVTLSYQQAGV